jgi:glycosyltransferase involved in cell wall biosynthesis
VDTLHAPSTPAAHAWPASGPDDSQVTPAKDARLRIALVGPLPPPAGGMANQTAQLARLLRADGVDVEIVQVNAPYAPAWIGRVRGVRALARLLPYLRRLWRAIGNCDVVHVMANSGWAWHLFAAPAIQLAARRGRPVVVNYRGGEAATFLARRARVVKGSLRRSSALVVPSGFLHAVFGSHGIDSRVVPNIVDVERFAPVADPAGDRSSTGAQAAPGTQSSPGAQAAGGSRPAAGPCLIVTRNLEPIYDVPTALRAFAQVRERHPHARLAVAGTGPARAALEALARQLGVRAQVEFTGRLDPAQIARLCSTADVMLNPARVDNMPNSVLEALAAGVPVVSTNVGGIPYIVEHERTALLVNAGDADAMARAALRVLGDAALRERLRREGREAALQYTWPRIGPQWLSLYRSLASARGAKVRA